MKDRTLTRSNFLKVSGTAVAGAYALGLAGCGSESGGGTAELTLLDHQEPRVELLKELLPQFEEEMKQQGKNIKVELQEGPAPDTEFLNKLTLDFSSDNAPDVTSFGNDQTAQFAASGYLLDLTPYTKKWSDWEGHFYEKLREQMVQPEGKVYTIPREAQIMQLFYRRDVLEQNNISTEQPQSWQDLLDRMKETTQAIGSPSLLFPAGEAWGGGTFGEGFIHLMLGTNSPLYQDGKWVVRSPGLTAVLNYYEDMVDAGVIPVQPLLNPEPWVPTKYEAFPKGELAATTCGTWCWIFDWGPDGAAPIDNLFQKVDTWQFPTEAGGETFIWGASGWVWAASADTEYPDEAWELVKWLSSGEVVARNAVTVGAASPRDDLQDVAPYSEKEFLIEAEKQLPQGRSIQLPVGTDKMVQAVGEATQAVITGDRSGDEAADLLAQQATELLGEDKVTELG
jgi:multiple sugar transport system substrate-binding protein